MIVAVHALIYSSDPPAAPPSAVPGTDDIQLYQPRHEIAYRLPNGI